MTINKELYFQKQMIEYILVILMRVISVFLLNLNIERVQNDIQS